MHGHDADDNAEYSMCRTANLYISEPWRCDFNERAHSVSIRWMVVGFALPAGALVWAQLPVEPQKSGLADLISVLVNAAR